MSRYDLVAVDDCICNHNTAKAILVEHGNMVKVWIAQSHIHDDSEVYETGTDGTLIIPRWVAEDKELPHRSYKG